MEYKAARAHVLSFLPWSASDRVLLVGEDLLPLEDYLNRCGVQTFACTEKEVLSGSAEGAFTCAVLYGGFFDPAGLISLIREKLSAGADIRFIILTGNRFGLTYFAGRRDENTGHYFEGLELQNAETSRQRFFSRKEWESILKETKLTDYSFLYPYPDYILPLCVFSDSFLPRRNELRRNIWNYDAFRMYLFNEQTAFNGIIGEGLFPEMSNAFLILPKTDVSYVKFSEGRDPRLSVNTILGKGRGGVPYVRKISAFGDTGREHIVSLPALREKLEDTYQENPFLSICGCRLVYPQKETDGRTFGVAAEFDYIRGTSAEELLDRCLEARGTGETVLLFDRFLHLIGDGKKEPFFSTPEFERIFGTYDLPEKTESLLATDIDLIPANLLVSDDHYTIIDYEWTFDFPVPLFYVLYRTIHYYLETNEKRAVLRNAGIYGHCGIDDSMLEICRSMEQHFQQFVQGECVPIRDCYSEVTPGVIFVPTLVAEAEQQRREAKLNVYFSYGEGFTEEITAGRFENGQISAVIDIPEGVCDVRIDPGDRYCACEVRRLALEQEPDPFWDTINGVKFNQNWVLFQDMDPQVSFARTGRGKDRLYVEMAIYLLPLDAARALFLQLKSGGKDSKPPSPSDAEPALPPEIPSYAEGEQSTGMLNPMDRGAGSDRGTGMKKIRLFSFIDRSYYDAKNKTLIIDGWAASSGSDEDRIKIFSSSGKPLAFTLTKKERPDVTGSIEMIHHRRNVGFRICVENPEEQAPKEGLSIRVFSGDQPGKTIFSLTARELSREYEDGLLRSCIDLARIVDGKVTISGWAVAPEGVPTLLLKNSDGSILPAEQKSVTRKDVAENFNLTDPDKIGFVLTADRSAITGRKLILEIAGEGTVQTKTFSLYRLDHAKDRTVSIRMVLYHLRHYGVKSALRYIRQAKERDYAGWFASHRVTKRQLRAQKKHVFDPAPKISICIPLYNTPLPFLKALIDSVMAQSYGNWELCLADGSTNDAAAQYIQTHYSNETRINYRKLEENYGIAGNTNAALSMADGEYVMLSDHDDFLEPDALYEIVSSISKNPAVDIVYTDEDLTDETGKNFRDPRFKPDYNRELLCSINYICHIFLVRRTILDQVGGFREEFDGAQDWDLILRCCEKTDQICHIPKVLYHWRAHAASTAGNPESKTYAIEAGRKALEEHYQRMGIDAELQYTGIFILFRTIMKVAGSPKVSIIIPNKDSVETLDTCLRSILEKSTYDSYEIIIVENNSKDDETFEYYHRIEEQSDRIHVCYYKGGWNYSAINNFGVRHASGDYYIFLNNDTEVIEPRWIEELLGYCQMKDVGIVGAKLFYPDDTVQHCGVVVGVGGFAGHILTNSSAGDAGYFGRLKAIQDISAVTAACLMIKKSSFENVGGFTEEFKVALNDIDLCLKVREQGELVVLNPWCRLYHYESKTRGNEETPEKHERFKAEIRRFRSRWSKILSEGDPYYSPNLTLMYGDCRIRGKYEHFDIIDEIEKES